MAARWLARAEALGLPVERLAANRLTGSRDPDPRRAYREAKATLALVVAPPTKLRLQPIPPSADWRFDLAEGCPAHCQYCYLAGSLPGPPVTRAYANLDAILGNLAGLSRPGRRHLGPGRAGAGRHHLRGLLLHRSPRYRAPHRLALGGDPPFRRLGRAGAAALHHQVRGGRARCSACRTTAAPASASRSMRAPPRATRAARRASTRGSAALGPWRGPAIRSASPSRRSCRCRTGRRPMPA